MSNKNYAKEFFYGMIFLLFLILLVLLGFSKIDEILYNPNITPEEWLEIQPWVELNIFSKKIILIQPSSTFFVYLLGILTIIIGLRIIRIRKIHKSRLWWGIALILWGIGALLAGTSYQVYSYEIKCAGRVFCLWTSLWEIMYLILSAGSVNAMMMAQSYSCAMGTRRRVLSIYAGVNMVLYVVIVVIGAFIPIKFMISFEMMIIFFVPNIIIFFIINCWRYYKSRDRMDLALLGTWISLGIIFGLYFLYLIMGITENLWEHGIWFSENDVLHIGLIIWMIYIGLTVSRHVKDTDGLVSTLKE